MAGKKEDFINICVEDEIINCDIKLLTTNSEYFYAMFNSNMTECFQDTVKLKQVNSGALKQVIKLCTTDDIGSKDFEDTLLILETACMLQFNNVVNKCTYNLIETMTSRNCLLAMSFAELHAIPKLYDTALKLSLWYAGDILTSSDIVLLNERQLEYYLSHIHLNVNNEKLVLEALIKWTKHEAIKRKSLFESLFSKSVKLNHMSCEELKGLMEDDWTKGFEKSFSEIKEMLNKRKISGVIQPSVNRKRCEALWLLKPSVFSENEGKVNHFITEAYTEFGKTSDNEVLHLSPVSIAPWEFIRCGPVGYRACLIDCSIYIFGGEMALGSGKWIKDVWKFHVFKKIWKTTTKLPSPRRHHSLTKHEDDVFLIGGFGNYRILLQDAYKYNSSKDEWLKLPDLIEPVYCAATTTHSKKLYVIKHQVSYLNICEKYNLCDTWTKLTICGLPFEVGLFNAISVGDKIYLTGLHSTSLYQLDPESMDLLNIGEFKSSKGWVCVKKYNDEVTSKESDILVAIGNECVEFYHLENRSFGIEMKSDIKDITSDHCVLSVPYLPEFKIRQ